MIVTRRVLCVLFAFALCCCCFAVRVAVCEMAMMELLHDGAIVRCWRFPKQRKWSACGDREADRAKRYCYMLDDTCVLRRRRSARAGIKRDELWFQSLVEVDISDYLSRRSRGRGTQGSTRKSANGTATGTLMRRGPSGGSAAALSSSKFPSEDQSSYSSSQCGKNSTGYAENVESNIGEKRDPNNGGKREAVDVAHLPNIDNASGNNTHDLTAEKEKNVSFPLPNLEVPHDIQRDADDSNATGVAEKSLIYLRPGAALGPEGTCDGSFSTNYRETNKMQLVCMVLALVFFTDECPAGNCSVKELRMRKQ